MDLRNRAIRNEGNLKFVQEEPDVDLSQLRTDVGEIISSAQTIADRVIVLSQPLAYSPNALPGVTRRWITLRPARNEEGAYLDNPSIANEIHTIQNEIRQIATACEVEYVDLSPSVAPLLSQTTELFDDKWHPAPAGAQLIGKVVAEYLQSPTAIVPAELPPSLPPEKP